MSNQDIFGYTRNGSPGAVFSPDHSTFTLGGKTVSLVQGWSVQYRQDVRELNEIGGKTIYWVRGFPVGAGTIDRIVYNADGDDLFSDAMNICKPDVAVTISGANGHCGPGTAGQGSNVNIKLHAFVVTTVAYSQSVEAATLAEKMEFRFSKLEKK